MTIKRKRNTAGDVLDESKASEELDLIFHVLQEHEERFTNIEKRLDEIKQLIEHYSLVVNRLEDEEKESEPVQLDVPQNILVVDDDPNVVKSFKMILEGAGYTIDTANTTLDAIRKVSRIHFDLVIVDMNLSDTLGDELSERLYSINKKLRILMITGYSNYKEQLEREHEFMRVLLKPINPEELVAIAKKTLQKR